MICWLNEVHKDRLALRQRLQGEGVTLQDSHNYRLDFEQLQEWSATEIEYQESQGRSKLIIGGKQLPITRPVVEVMLEAAKTQSFLVVGGAGTGKTGCLLTLANRLKILANEFGIGRQTLRHIILHKKYKILQS